MTEAHTSILLTVESLQRAEALLPTIRESKAYKGAPRLSRSFVLRLAIERGLDALEAEFTRRERRKK